MINYLNSALEGYARRDEETYRIRAGAYLLSLRSFHEASDEATLYGARRALVYDAFAFLAVLSDKYFRSKYYLAEDAAYQILLFANAENDTRLGEAGEAMAALTPFEAWSGVTAAPPAVTP